MLKQSKRRVHSLVKKSWIRPCVVKFRYRKNDLLNSHFQLLHKPPTNLGLTVNNSTSISANWQLPLGISRNGPIRGFTLYYKKKGASGQANTVTVHDGTVLSKTITGMEKYTEYDIQVSAFTYAGEGPKSSVVTERTSKDGKTCLTSVRMEAPTCTMRLLNWYALG